MTGAEDLGEGEIGESRNTGGDPGFCFFGVVGDEVDKTEEEAERLIVSDEDAQRCGASCDPREPTEVPAGSAFADSDPGSAPGHADEENGCHACLKFEGASARENLLEKTYPTAKTVERTRGDAEPLTGAAVAFDLRIEGENDAAICIVPSECEGVCIRSTREIVGASRVLAVRVRAVCIPYAA